MPLHRALIRPLWLLTFFVGFQMIAPQPVFASMTDTLQFSEQVHARYVNNGKYMELQLYIGSIDPKTGAQREGQWVAADRTMLVNLIKNPNRTPSGEKILGSLKKLLKQNDLTAYGNYLLNLNKSGQGVSMRNQRDFEAQQTTPKLQIPAAQPYARYVDNKTFHQLELFVGTIDPVTGQPKEGKWVPANREQLVQMLENKNRTPSGNLIVDSLKKLTGQQDLSGYTNYLKNLNKSGQLVSYRNQRDFEATTPQPAHPVVNLPPQTQIVSQPVVVAQPPPPRVAPVSPAVQPNQAAPIQRAALPLTPPPVVSTTPAAAPPAYVRQPGTRYTFFYQDNNGHENLYFVDNRNPTMQPQIVLVNKPRVGILARAGNDSDPFMQEFKQQTGITDVRALLAANQNPNGGYHNFLSKKTVQGVAQDLQAVNAAAQLQAAMQNLNAAGPVCAGPPQGAGPPALTSVKSYRKMIEFYHDDPKKCDYPASSVNQWLGNFYVTKTPITVPWGSFTNSEAAYQARKCLYWSGHDRDRCIRAFESAKDGEVAFSVSKSWSLPKQNVQDWLAQRDHAMQLALESKFSQPDLLKALCQTYPTPLRETIPEGRSGDTGAMHWGCPPNLEDKPIKCDNMLGKQLTQIRDSAEKNGTCPR